MKPGTTVYSTSDCGDWTPETGSVVIPKGIPATYEGVRECPQVRAPRAFFSIPTSPGQKVLTCCPDQIEVFWSMKPPSEPIPYEKLTVWERLRKNPYQA